MKVFSNFCPVVPAPLSVQPRLSLTHHFLNFSILNQGIQTVVFRVVVPSRKHSEPLENLYDVRITINQLPITSTDTLLTTDIKIIQIYSYKSIRKDSYKSIRKDSKLTVTNFKKKIILSPRLLKLLRRHSPVNKHTAQLFLSLSLSSKPRHTFLIPNPLTYIAHSYIYSTCDFCKTQSLF